MVEHEDWVKNVNVADVKNPPKTGYVAQTDNVTQNENIVEIEKPSQNEDLYQYLLHPRNTWAYDITIIVHCKLKLIHDFKEVLASCGELEEFKKSCFRHYLDLPHYMRGLFQAKYIHNLLPSQIQFLSANDDEMWLAMGNTKLTGLSTNCHTRLEEKEVYWLGIDEDMFEGPQFVPLKDFVNKED
ncbi:hypothetical protein Ddye_012918 [Dipteronia dyeriana]|uniref:Uncharacterized protein n=1 Tax=Dipteronia dyeriana TaxID=168575 RepID=A0AAD9X5H2_9ROSI|nr:hypothetical protein Ddye_012918 [Dipteronia dyeriana]